MPRLNSQALKVTCALDPNEIVAIPDIGTARTVLHIQVAGFGAAVADIAAKSLRRAQATISEHGTDAVACVLQGKLVAGGKITEAGLVAQLRAPKPVEAEAAA